MKLHGYLRGSGRLGNIVCARVGRETIAKTHNPKKANPNTEKQVNERSRFKLITQLAASYAPVIAIPKEGNQSKRNRFIHRNYDILHAEGGQASIDLTQIQLTRGRFYIPELSVQLSYAEGNISIKLEEENQASISRIVYGVFYILDSGKIALANSKVIENNINNKNFATIINTGRTKGIIYAYGIKDKDKESTTKYESWNVKSAENIAKLIARRAIDFTKYAFSRTRGCIFNLENLQYNITKIELLETLTTRTYYEDRIKTGVIDNIGAQWYGTRLYGLKANLTGYLLGKRSNDFVQKMPLLYNEEGQYYYNTEENVNIFNIAYIYIENVLMLILKVKPNITPIPTMQKNLLKWYQEESETITR